MENSTIHLVVLHEIVEWDRPLFARVIATDEIGHGTIFPEVLLALWVPVDRMTSILTAYNAKSKVFLPADLPFVTQFCESDGLFCTLGAIGAMNTVNLARKLNELSWIQSSDEFPSWYVEEEHKEAFAQDDGLCMVDYDNCEVLEMLRSVDFKRRFKADQLMQTLDEISHGNEGADKFHRWVVQAISCVYFRELTDVRKNPNGSAAERRDIVATSHAESGFWRRLLTDYRVRMPVFEVKNYECPTPDDFRQVYSYLGHPHHGTLGFIVTRSKNLIFSKSVLQQFREMYRKDGLQKLIIVLPSVFLEELLSDMQRGRSSQVDRKMNLWLEEFLLKHLNE
ncbi:hypothetical protein [Burkholderia vietnamiensis]|uniref:hypothetical protein n=1 Tax=Burkholderia vietnamiensis TaxID=60552 RepID=UPI001BA03B2F|nr:hypothetical protein [Burkholderia vietnamiensis]MBR8031883.1 hypothetical protein [Burkholderia vietnamiensis]